MPICCCVPCVALCAPCVGTLATLATVMKTASSIKGLVVGDAAAPPVVNIMEFPKTPRWRAPFCSLDSALMACCPLHPLMYMLEWPPYEAVNNPVTGACCSLSAWWCAATEPEWSTYPDEWEFHEVIPQFPTLMTFVWVLRRSFSRASKDATCSMAVLYACLIPGTFIARRRVVRKFKLGESAVCTALSSIMWPCALNQAYEELNY
jgi:hypothetical protein